MWRVRAYETLESTNLIVKEYLRQGLPEGCVVVSSKQEGGYGRQGRTWASPAGGLYVSFGLRPSTPFSELSTLTLVVALAVRDALAELGYATSVKWPNDILLDEGKVCGISCEVVAGAVCVGVGLNVYKPQDRVSIQGKYHPAYLCSESYSCARHQIGFLETCMVTILNAFESRYEAWQQEGFASVSAYYNEVLAMKGSLVRVATVSDNATAEGIVVGVDEKGRLLLEVNSEAIVADNGADGAEEVFTSENSAEMATALLSGTKEAGPSVKKVIAVSSGEVHLL